ncbi:hypothetical protein C2845_PM07G18040 [Panicum miliaceum]|uniref:Uncharacterized protein n=1 Tax=Panicum miliaceum TaxID=4540 RepID=A0A3L6SHQ4_PANMI|nr:hypothetical protein C2845_PM07G18040 [Panicum miliaceum]
MDHICCTRNRQNVVHKEKRSHGARYRVAVHDGQTVTYVSVNHYLVGGKSPWQCSAPSSFRPAAYREIKT